jgi:hypothetical protein
MGFGTDNDDSPVKATVAQSVGRGKGGYAISRDDNLAHLKLLQF